MIAPCFCRGDLKFVHRKCLDEYRAFYQVEHPSFTQCTTCGFEYIFEMDQDWGCCGSPHIKFRLRVARDVICMVVAFLAVISFMAWMFVQTDFIQQRYPGQHWKYSYASALALFFCILGIAGVIHGCVYACNADDDDQYANHNYQYNACDCNGCIYVGHVNTSDCNCGSGGSSSNNDGAEKVLAVLAVILCIIGVVYALIMSSILIGRMSTKHYAKLEAKLMTREYVVKDLQKYSRKQILIMQHEQKQQKQIENPTHTAPELDEYPQTKPNKTHYTME